MKILRVVAFADEEDRQFDLLNEHLFYVFCVNNIQKSGIF